MLLRTLSLSSPALTRHNNANIVTALFSYAIIRFSQEWITSHKPNRVFHLKVLLAFRHQALPWGLNLKDVKYLTSKDRWWPAILVLICFFTFPHLVSSPTSLLSPGPFNQTVILNGTELDFSSTDVNCLDYLKSKPLNPLSNNCTYNVSQTSMIYLQVWPHVKGVWWDWTHHLSWSGPDRRHPWIHSWCR